MIKLRNLLNRILIFVFGLILLNLFLLSILNSVSASVQLGNLSHEIETSYTKLKPIKGWINVSLNNEPSTTLISGFNTSLTLKEFLEKNDLKCNLDLMCSCFPKDCQSGYSEIGGLSNEKIYKMKTVETKLFGVKLTSNISRITGFKFNVSTDGLKSCINPLMIDLLDDQNIDFKVSEVSDEECFIEKSFGCYNPIDLKGATEIETNSLCGKITLPGLRGFRVGAVISGNGTETFSFTLQGGGSGGSCTVVVNTGGEIFCKIVLSEELKDQTTADVCISANRKTNYKINFEDKDACGFVEVSGEKFLHDYEIFAKPLKYQTPKKLSFDNRLFSDQTNLTGLIFNYINKKFPQCNPNCLIPIRIYSGNYQNITISNLLIDYDVNGLNPIGSEETGFYNLNITPALISSEFLKLDLEKTNFLTPLTTGIKDFVLTIGDLTIIKNISIIDISGIKTIVPTKVSYLVPTRFIAIIDRPSVNATYTWNFGDGVIETTYVNTANHTYSKLRNYELTVNLSNEKGVTTKTQTITVISPYKAINDSIIEYRKRFISLDSSLLALPDLTQEKIKQIINIDELKKSVDSLENKYKLLFMKEEEELVKIMDGLDNLKIPYKLDVSSEIKSMKFIQNKDRLNLPIIGEFGAGNFDEDQEQYYNVINRWINENLDINLESKTYSFFYPDASEQVLLSELKLTLVPKSDIDEFYMIIDGDTSKIKFFEDYREREIDSTKYGVRLELKAGEEKKIEFLYPERIEILNPPISISPLFSKLEFVATVSVCNNNNICDKGENYKNCRVDCKPWKLTLLFLGILFLIAFIVYIILQEWYKRRYETFLFKDRNQLFNLMVFMTTATNQGFDKKKIFDELRSKGWNKEQLEYAWKKFRGERTGMWEIPILRPFEKLSIKREVEKRQMTGEYRPSSFSLRK